MGSRQRSRDSQEYWFLAQNAQAINVTRTDRTVSRFKLVLAAIRAVPKPIAFAVAGVMWVACVIFVIPGVCILIELLSNRLSLLKVVGLGCFVLTTLVVYFLVAPK
jgi:hypothetical protein